jgi:hypothetical protein
MRTSRGLPAALRLALALGLAMLLALVFLPAVSEAATPKCFGATRTILGNNKANVLKGTAGRNVIVALGGKDRIYPGNGADLVCAGAGNDVISAYDGFADRISCGPGVDTVYASYIDVIGSDCERKHRTNHRPTGIRLSKSSVDENQPKGATVGSLLVTDADPGDRRTFRLVDGPGANDNSRFTISGSVLKTNALFDAESRSELFIRVRVEDAAKAAYEKALVVTVKDINEAPKTLTLSSSSVNEGLAPNAVVGTIESFDDDAGDTQTFSLVPGVGSTDNSSFAVSGDELRANNKTFDREVKGSYLIRLRVTDSAGKFLEKAFTITIGNVNESPTDLSLSTTTIPEHLAIGSTAATLSNNDPDADTGDTQLFTLVPGTGSEDNASFTIAGKNLRPAAVFDAAVKTTYKIRVQTSDGVTPGAPQKAFTITVAPINDVPSDIALSNNTVAENQPVATTVGTLSSTDLDPGDSAAYSLVSDAGSTDNAAFEISGTTLRTKAVLDFEAKSSYSVRIRVTDGGGNTYDEIFAVTVTNANDAPTDISLAPATIAENQPSGTTVGTLTAADQDAGDTRTFTLVGGAGSTDNASFDITGSALKANAVFDREAKASYAIRIRVTDAGGKFFEKQFTITVTNVNEAPTDIALSKSTVPENAAVGTTVGTLSATDPDVGDTRTFALVAGGGSTDNASFEISGTTLKTKAIFNLEARASYSIRVRATDAGGKAFEEVLTISVTNVNEAPTDITLTGSTVAENAAVGATVGTLGAVDPDAGDSKTFTLVTGTGSDNNASFDISGGTLVTKASFNFEAKASYTVRVRVTDGGSLTREEAFTIAVTNVNEVPTDIALSKTTVAENSVVGTTVGTLSAADPDAGDVRTFTLVAGAGSDDNASFEIAGTSLTTKAAFDFETKSAYTVRVRVTDGGGLTREEAFAITVTPVNENPTDITLGFSSVPEKSPVPTTVGGLSATDPDTGDTATFTLVAGAGSTDNASFQVTGTSLTTKAIFDFESKATYSVRVRATDAGGKTFEKVFTIAVTNVNEAPTNIALSGTTVAENAATGTAVGTFTATDPEPADAEAFSLVAGSGSTDNASFEILGGVLKTTAVFDLESKASYSIRVRATDGGGLSFEKVFTINVTNVNEAPTNIALSASSVAENSVIGATVGTLSATDPDAGDTRTFTLVAGSGSDDNASFEIAGTTLKTKAVFDRESKSSYTVRVRVTDGGGLLFEKQFTITVTNVNEAPSDIALSGSSVAENAPVPTSVGTLTATDPDASDTAAFTLVAGADDNASFEIVAGVLRTKASFNFESKGSYTVRVRVTDAGGLTREEVFTITVTNVNEAPTDIALSGSSVAENATIGATVGTLGATDPDAGDTAAFTLVAGTGDDDNASFEIVGGVLKAKAVFDREAQSSYSILVRATDSGGLTRDKTFTITVTNVNEVPTDIALSGSNVAENLASGTLVGTLSATDPDASDPKTFTLVAGPGSDDNASFEITGTTVKTKAVFDREAKAGFSVRVRVTDSGGLTFEKQFTITVTNVNEAPTDITLSSTSVLENAASGTLVGTLGGADPDVGDSQSFALVSGAADNASFQISGSELQTNAVFNFEAKSSYTVQVRLTDSGGLTRVETFGVTVTNVNEAPTNIALSASSVAENAATGTPIGALSAIDPDAAGASNFAFVSGVGDDDNGSFQIVAGTLQTNAVFNFEAKSSYVIRVKVTDGGGLTFEKQFTVTVTNVNEAPTDITLSSTSVAENAAAPATVGTLSATDPDAGATATFSLVPGAGDDDNALLQIVSGSLRVIASPNFEAKSSYQVRIRVSDGTSPFEKQFTIAVTNVNEAPTDIALSGSSTVPENASPTATVGTLSAVDPDAGDTKTFTLVPGTGSTDNASFDINGTTLVAAAVFNFEAKPSYSVRVRVTDSAGLFFDEVFAISVTNVNEAPTDIALSASTIAENASATATIGTLSATDPDAGDSRTFTLVAGPGSTDNGSFSITGPTLKADAVFDFEAKSSYSVRVRVTDTAGLSFDEVFTISVTNVNEAPTDIVLAGSTVPENAVSGTTVGTLSGTDPDAADSQSFALVSGAADNASFQLNGSELRTNAVFNFEAKSSYTVQVRLTDSGGMTRVESFAIAVTNVNEAPTNITGPVTTVPESLPVGADVGTLLGVDPDAAGANNFALASGAGDDDNASFDIVAGTLRTGALLDFETKPALLVRLRVTDGGGLSFEKQFTITVTNVNEAPTNITLSGAATVVENAAVGTTIGTLAAADPDAAGASTFAFATGAGDDDNGSFQISGGNTLKTDDPINFETDPTVTVRLKVTDPGGLTFEKQFTITVTNVNEAPTDIALSSSSLAENASATATIGTVSATDPDAGDGKAYELVSGPGSTDNGSFDLTGTTLKADAVFDFEAKSSYTVRVRVTDTAGLTFEKAFTVSVTNVNEAPTGITLGDDTIDENEPIGTTVGTLAGADPDAGDTRTFTLVAGEGADDNDAFTIAGSALKSASVFDFEAKSSYTVRVRVTDEDGLDFEKQLTITVADIAD